MTKEQSLQDKIKSISADLELVAHITSHDLRDPLRQAIINLEQMQNNSSGQDNIDSTISSINEVLERIALLRQYSYLANFNKDMEQVDCGKILDLAIEELTGQIDDSNAVITSDSLPEITGYADHLLILFSALIANAIKFNNSDIPSVDISCKKQDGQWQFKFSDNGIGLESVYQNFVFALFQRLDPDAQDAGYGTGLAFAKKIVENHGGKIWFESDGENGCDFYFTLSAK